MEKLRDTVKKFFVSEKKEMSEGEILLKNLDETKEELEQLNQSLRFVTDPILLNQLIFQVKAAEVRYRYWFCLAREMNLKISEEKTQTNV